MIRIPKSTRFRAATLVLSVISLYAIGYLVLRKGMGLAHQDFMVAFGIFTGAILMTTYLTVNHWLVWATIEPEVMPFELTRARTILDELGAKVGFHVAIRVVATKKTFIYSAGLQNKLVVISDSALTQLSEEALRGVLAHEVAHMVMNHARKNAAVFTSFFGLRMALAFPSHLNIYVALLLFMYLRNNEYEADKLACILTNKSAMTAALNEVQELTKMREFGRIFEFFISTHPSYARRRDAIAAYQ